MAAALGAAPSAQAQPAAVESVEAGTFLPLAFSPQVGAEAGFASLTTSYEGGGERAVFEAAAEARLLPWLAVRTGIAMRSNPDQKRPLVAVRAQVLDQASHGLDASVGLSYEPDGIREAEGRMSLAVAAARRFGGVGLMTSVAYGQDPESDDRQVDARAAALVRVGTRVHAGLAAGVRGDLFSDDPKRKEGEPELELTAGPLASVAVGSFAVFAQMGIDAARVDTMKTGVLALGGMGASF